jgi:glycosyltransferase involved in cell wall biosynthesis
MTEDAKNSPFSRVRVSVVIPTLNEAQNLPHVISRIPSWVNEVVLVDGNSVDGTVMVAQALWPNRHIVLQERRRRAVPVPQDRRGQAVSLRLVTQERRGKGAALRSGFAAATGDIIVMLDADGSTDPVEITAFVGALLSGADFAKGSRFLQGGGTTDMPIHRRLGNAAFVAMVRVLFGGQYTDLCYGYNAFWSWTVPLLNLDGDGFEIETMMNIRALEAGLKIVEIPSFEAPRIHGVGRLRTIPDGWRVLKTVVRERLRPTQQRRVRPEDRPLIQLKVREMLIPRTGGRAPTRLSTEHHSDEKAFAGVVGE